jgi:hypothetical protein
MLLNNSKINKTYTAYSLAHQYPMAIDSGATTHAFTKENTGIDQGMVTVNLPFSNITPTSNGIQVMFPDGNLAQATHTATLNLPTLPQKARQVHLFKALASGALISLGQLCDAGCTAYFNATTAYIFHQGKIIMQGSRNSATNNRLWKIDNSPTGNSITSLNAVIDKPTISERIKFYHASLFSPTLDTLAKALQAGYLTTFPSFTVKQLRQFPPRSEATVKGHMRAQRKGLQQVLVPSPRVNNITPYRQQPVLIEDDSDDTPSTAILPTPPTLVPPPAPPSPASPTAPPTALPLAQKATPTTTDTPINTVPSLPPATSPNLRTNHIFPACLPISGQIYTDQSGKVLITSASGMNYIFLLYDYDSNLIWAVPIPTRTKLQILKAYKSTLKLLQSRGLKPQLQRIDNECSALLKEYMAQEHVTFQLTPKGKHARNAAEKGIQIWKDHFLAGVATASPNFPITQWDKLIDQANITLNLLRPSRINPQLSAYAQVFGAFDYNKTPLPPPGMRVLAHVLPSDRTSFGPHAIAGYAIGPAMEHYRCFKIFIPTTGRIRIADTVKWFPHGDLKLPIASKEALLHASIQDLSATIKSSIKNGILPPDGTTNRQTLLDLHHLFNNKAQPAPTTAPAEVPRVSRPTHPTAALPKKPTPKQPANALPRVVPSPTAPTPAAIQAHARTLRMQRRDLLRNRLTVHKSARTPQIATANSLAITNDALIQQLVSPDLAHAVLNPITGKLEEYRKLQSGADSTNWVRGMFNELARLAQGSKLQNKTGTNTIAFKHPNELPPKKKATYARIVANYRPQKADPYRIRITVGGDRITYIGETFTPNADMTTAKTLFNSTLSTPNARFMGIDLKDFYLGTYLPTAEYMYLQRWLFPPEFIAEYNLHHLFNSKDRILCEITKGMYGLPQAGRLAYESLLEHLNKAGYVRTGITPGLFRHTSRDIIFSLVVDDFGVRYTRKEDALHLINHLEKDYVCTTDWDGKIFLGMHLQWDYQQRTVKITMPGYVKKALQRFEHPTPTHHQSSPHPYTPPQYGAKVQYAQSAEPSTLTAEQKKFAQQVIGVFLFYGRAIDSTMLAAIGSIACALSTATWTDLHQRITQFLDYAGSNPNAALVYKASDMNLWIHTDASYLAETRARSRAGGFHYFSDKPTLPLNAASPPPMHNHPVLVVCKVIDAVMSSTQESETGAGFINAREGLAIRQAAIEMGHPQGPTPLQFDNLCATRILTGEIKQKQSKSMDMRFYWLRDRALEQRQFNIHWKTGDRNLGDYPTKHHPKKHHKEIRHMYVANSIHVTRRFRKAAQNLRGDCKGVLETILPSRWGSHA